MVPLEYTGIIQYLGSNDELAVSRPTESGICEARNLGMPSRFLPATLPVSVTHEKGILELHKACCTLLWELHNLGSGIGGQNGESS